MPGDFYSDIADFHVKFGLMYQGPPRYLPFDLDGFRTKFMAEELAEYITNDKGEQEEVVWSVENARSMEGMKSQPELEKKLDALVDLVYVALGTAYLHGFDFNEAWRRVHAANMKKVRAVHAHESTRQSTNDVVKPPGWTPPDLSDLVG